MRVVAIDPGYERMGIAVLDREKVGSPEKLTFSKCIHSNPKEGSEKRLAHIYSEVERIVDEYAPDVCAIETIFLSTNQKTAMLVASARGVVLSVVGKQNIPLFEYSPPQIKTAVTGYGRSDKKQVTSMVKRLIGGERKGALDDEYDAIAIGLTYFAIEKNIEK